MSGSDDHVLQLPSDDAAPGKARRALAAWLRGDLGPDALRDAELLVSELVTNGVRHGPDGGLELRVSRRGGRVRIAVSDRGGRFHAPAPVEPPAHAVGGRGLLIVDRIASGWGVAHDGRNTVWFEL